MVKCELLQLGAPWLATPTKMSALAAVQSLDTAHHMHSLLLSHGNEWNISFGRDQGAAMVKCELLQFGEH